MDIILPLLLQVVLIMLNAIFACAEIAVISVNEAKLNKLISENNKKAKTIKKLTENPSRFLSTIQIAITLSGFLGSAFAADNFADPLVDLVIKNGWVLQNKAEILNTIFVVLITVILSYFTLVFGELIPKRIGMRKAESIALSLAGFLLFVSNIFRPIVFVLTASINCILKLIGIDPNQSDGDEGEENIRLMVDMSGEKGLIDKEEQEMIQNVFDFDDLTVEDFATHRTDVEFLWEEDGIEVWDKIIRKTFHKYYPVCREDKDDVIGILNVKKYFTNTDKNIKKAIEPAYFVPSTLKADILFKQMKETKNKFAVLIDEHGGVQGIVTMDDILEQIVGEFNSDNGNVEGTAVAISDNLWEINGMFTIEETNEIFGTNLSDEENDTLNGFIFAQYGKVPSDGEKFEIEIENLKINVKEIKDRRIEKMTIEKI